MLLFSLLNNQFMMQGMIYLMGFLAHFGVVCLGQLPTLCQGEHFMEMEPCLWCG